MWNAFLITVIIYIIWMIGMPIVSIDALFSLNFLLFFQYLGIAAFAWINVIILCKYSYRCIYKTIKKEPISQKEIIYFITSLLTFITTGVLATPALRI